MNDPAKAAALAAHQQKEQRIFENFTTPLMGTHLNLTKESVELLCPACGVKEHTRVEQELKWWAAEINRFVGCLFIALCCCCFLNRATPCQQMDWNHYCVNCGCFLGRSMRHAPLPPKARKRFWTMQ